MKRRIRQSICVLMVCLMAVFLGGCGTEKKPISCRISIQCGTIMDQKDKLKAGKEKYVPEDGWILPEQTVEMQEGDSVFDLLQKVCRENEIQMEYSSSPVYRTAYIEGIHQIYEMDCGSSSGWMYRVNGVYPNYGASKCLLKDNDQVEFLYTCDLGKDIGKEPET